jgi:putative DNA primase/helicase
MLDAALDYTRYGLALFPIWPALPAKSGGYICGCGRLTCSNPAKHPLGRLVPHGLKDASADASRVQHFWRCRPDANIGCATDPIVVVDIDPRHGGDIATVEKTHGRLPPTWTAATGGGGSHIYFQAPPAPALICNSTSKLGDGIDIRARGGYIVLPPSNHISGGRYAWQAGCAPDQLPLAPLPTSIKTVLETSAKARCAWHELASQEVEDGKRNTTIARFAGHLLRHFVDPRVALELLLAWNATHCLPPLSRAEVIHTVDSVAGKEFKRRGYE